MNEFKVGDKVLAEVKILDEDRPTGRYRVSSTSFEYSPNSVSMPRHIYVDKVHPIPTKTYEDGLQEAWDLARRISSGKEHGGFDLDELEEIFKASIRAEVFRKFTPQKAADCIALWEARQNIQVQDQVRYGDTNCLGVVMKVVGQDDDIEYYVWWGSGSSSYERADDLTKTGRTIDITGLLAQIGGIGDER